MDFKRLLHEQVLAAVVAAFKLQSKSLAEDAQCIVVGVQGTIDHWGDETLGIVGKQGLFEDTLARARLTEEQAQSALLGVDEEDVEDFLLVSQ